MENHLQDKSCERSDAAREKGEIIRYGTTGLRFNGQDVISVSYRCGVVVGLLSKAYHPQKIGIMITASHNPIEDNGFKIVDPYGAMLNPKVEGIIEAFLNVKDINEGVLSVKSGIHSVFGKPVDMSIDGVAHIAMDTRPSSPIIQQLVQRDGILSQGSSFEFHGEITTPLLHFITHRGNFYPSQNFADLYFSTISNGFINFVNKFPDQQQILKQKLAVDCANGVGHFTLEQFIARFGDKFPVEIVPVNHGDIEQLNNGCGSDYVHNNLKFPKGYEGLADNCVGSSLDGDADRSLLYVNNDKGEFRMIEGTRMSVIFSKCIRQLIAELISAGEKAASPIADLAKSWTHGVVYTPYSNYAGIYYLRDIEKIPLVLAKTGVKYVHHESIKFDFGVYFESNGHGDVTFDRLKMNALKEEYKNESNPELRDKLDNFFNFLDIVNDTVGDGFANVLVFLASCVKINWSIQDVVNLYDDLPFISLKALVPDRYLIKVNKTEEEVVQPEGLQAEIEAVFKQYPNSRCFVRPSGTEDIVRVFVQAANPDHLHLIGNEVVKIVQNHPAIVASG